MPLSIESPVIDANEAHKFEAHYSSKQRFRIPGFLAPSSATRIATVVKEIRDYELVFFAGNENKAVRESELRKHSDETRGNLQAQIFQNAANGVGFLYGRHPIIEGEKQAPLLEFKQWLNSPQTIDWVRTVTGHHDISHADANVTRFARGEFLTRHNDVAPNETRRVAFVMNLSEQWHADWGGLLQFFESDGTSVESYTPTFNSLSLFDVSRPHSVTCVAPFSPALRLSISGWFRA
ncbi:2OG-Fe(II) oxygenase [Glaciecola sp. MH2013]|uniref:2OG-Fe(II) oxygenase n=1 Tax=Glaciecola sp. MH2013 TaxID=2785524 RepID=UPI0018A0B05C|nr:2OG-Fe(II) oxygenase family protein [Glaciecola sp. MH2013]MBF7072438.1 2OG-Fe(II) oxygenase [Glaciecola sp. MH2013]